MQCSIAINQCCNVAFTLSHFQVFYFPFRQLLFSLTDAKAKWQQCWRQSLANLMAMLAGVQCTVEGVQCSHQPRAEHPASGPPSPGASLGELWDDSSSDKTSRSTFMAISRYASVYKYPHTTAKEYFFWNKTNSEQWMLKMFPQKYFPSLCLWAKFNDAVSPFHNHKLKSNLHSQWGKVSSPPRSLVSVWWLLFAICVKRFAVSACILVWSAPAQAKCINIDKFLWLQYILY